MSDIVRHKGIITREDRNRLNKHKSGVLWFTGLSGAGKSTLAHGLEAKLFKLGIRAYVLDGDNIRHGLNSDLGFSREDRQENIRRIVEVTKLFVDAGMIIIAAFISPYEEDRNFARNNFLNDEFFEVYIKCPLETCEMRDPKDRYEKARKGLIKGYTGIDSPYEEPRNPDLILETDRYDIQECLKRLTTFIRAKGLIKT